jgi:hypothetical protein
VAFYYFTNHTITCIMSLSHNILTKTCFLYDRSNLFPLFTKVFCDKSALKCKTHFCFVFSPPISSEIWLVSFLRRWKLIGQFSKCLQPDWPVFQAAKIWSASFLRSWSLIYQFFDVLKPDWLVFGGLATWLVNFLTTTNATNRSATFLLYNHSNRIENKFFFLLE